MKTMLLTVLASLSLASVCAVADTTYVVDSSGNPVKTGDQCVVAAGSGTSFDSCGGAMADTMAKQEPAAPAPAPKIITKVIVDCSKCPK